MLALNYMRSGVSYRHLVALDHTFVQNTAPLYRRLRNCKKWEFQSKKVTFKAISPDATPGSQSSGSFTKISTAVRIAMGIWDENQTAQFAIDNGQKSYRFKGQSAPQELKESRVYAEFCLSINLDGEKIKVSCLQNGMTRRNLILVSTDGQSCLEVIESQMPVTELSLKEGDVGRYVDGTVNIPIMPFGRLSLSNEDAAAILKRESLPSSHTALVESLAKGRDLNSVLKLFFRIRRESSSRSGYVLENIHLHHTPYHSAGVEFTSFQDNKAQESMSLVMRGTGDISALALPTETWLNTAAWLTSKKLQVSFPDLMQSGKAGPDSDTAPAIALAAEETPRGLFEEPYSYHDAEESVKEHVTHDAWTLLDRIAIGQQLVFPTLVRYGVVTIYEKKTSVKQKDGYLELAIGLDRYIELYKKEYENARGMIGGATPPDTTVPGEAVLEIVYQASLLQFYDESGRIPPDKQAEAHAAGLENMQLALKQLCGLPEKSISARWKFDTITIPEK